MPKIHKLLIILTLPLLAPLGCDVEPEPTPDDRDSRDDDADDDDADDADDDDADDNEDCLAADGTELPPGGGPDEVRICP